jgi:hypothetical protein
MFTFEGRWNRWVLLADTLFLNLANDKATPRLGPFTNAQVQAKTLIFDPEFGYQVFRREGVELNVLGGERFWHLKNDLDFSRGGVERLEVSHTRNWVDPTVGAQFRRDLSRILYVTAKGDIGGFDAAASIDWQAFGGLGMKFNDRISGIVGYRHLAVDYANQGFLFDLV